MSISLCLLCHPSCGTILQYRKPQGCNIFLHSRTHVCPCPTNHHTWFYCGQQTWLWVNFHREDYLWFFEEPVVWDGHGNKRKRDEGDCIIHDHTCRLNMKFLQSPETQTHADFNEDLAEEALGELYRASEILFSLCSLDPTCPFTLSHHDLSLSSILVDPATFKIMGMVNWGCTGTQLFWEVRYLVFLQGDGIEEQPEPLSLGDQNVVKIRHWKGW